MSKFTERNAERQSYDYDCFEFGLKAAVVIMLTMTFSTPIINWLLTGKPSSGMIGAALVIAVVISIPTASAAIFHLNRGKSAALPAFITLIISYSAAMIMISAMIGNFVMQGSDIIYMGIPAVVIFAWVKYQEYKIAQYQ